MKNVWIIGLHHLPKIYKISYKYTQTNNLHRLYIYDCAKLNNRYCLYNYHTKINKEMIQYINILKITQWYKRIKFLHSNRYKTLWKIAEYYTSKKYSPENVLKYLCLD